MKYDAQTKSIRAVIDCPVCFSGNTFDIDNLTPPLFCDDCGFTLADSVKQIREGICFFCGNKEFYAAQPLVPVFFQKSLACYVCEARYNGFESDEGDKEFDDQKASELRFSESAIKLRERIEQYNQA